MSPEALLDRDADAVGVPSPTDVWLAGAHDEQPKSFLEQIPDDEDLSTADLVEVIAHSAATISAANYRMLQCISLLYEAHEEEYGCEVAEKTSGESSLAEIAESAAKAACGLDPREQFGPDGLDRTVADVGAVLSMSPGAAKGMIMLAEGARYRLPLTGAMLGIGRIDLQRLKIAAAATELCDPELLPEIDVTLSNMIGSRDQMSTQRFTNMVKRVVSTVDRSVSRHHRQRAQSDRGVSVGPDRFRPGQARMTAQLPTADGALVGSQLDAMAERVHKGDPRTKKQRRADALIALIQGGDRLTCECEDCTAVADDRDEATDDSAVVDTEASHTDPDHGSACASEELRAEQVQRLTEAQAECTCECADHRHESAGPRGTIFVVANESTLAGEDDHDALIDGYGPIDADSVRELAEAEFTRKVGVSPESALKGIGGLKYRPGKRLQAFIRVGELCCTWPGCNEPVWKTDLDHSDPFDHQHPERGGPTEAWNLKPLCRFHHRMKTFGRWRDFQDTMMTVMFQSPTGHWFVGNAFRGIDMFPGLKGAHTLRYLKNKPPDHPARTAIDARHAKVRAADQRALKRWDDAHPPPF
ncbi:HNH endonuclease [Gordonia oryzae]|uniref:HNH endonuclease n=1 Tax=Gordonia oryzae TaxID=2487349 RepID=A0A3N4GW41_9ACTN|nr:HNH endonuclease signature motif containing protein [Gordonia oryzae]RPA65647.1 HNH endonuclease [Gordonia oryzae]